VAVVVAAPLRPHVLARDIALAQADKAAGKAPLVRLRASGSVRPMRLDTASVSPRP
jgi:hypothetical protein